MKDTEELNNNLSGRLLDIMAVDSTQNNGSEPIMLRNGVLISDSSGYRGLVDIYIEDGYINEIIPREKRGSINGNGARRIEMNGSIVAPSFTDAHMHLLQWSLYREA
ncbi:MAG: hypothetical protein U9R75_05995, partial [Candidatus Thermoplasmatota archaeon]|nr:hypothetical protein [Candidatus Thermoplasmatota archaeon]